MNIPASYHQERLWFIDRFERKSLYENGPVYHNIPLIINIEGIVDAKVLEESIIKVIKRHEVLRTRIITKNDAACQVIEDESDFRLERVLVDDGRVNGKDKNEYVLKYAKEAFDLENSQLIRAALFDFNSKSYALLLTIHHIICDRYSLGIIANEIVKCYVLTKTGEKASLEELELHYADFSDWQRDLCENDLESLLFYWRRKLGGKLQALELPTDRQRAPIHIYHEGRAGFEIPDLLARKIADFSKKHNIVTFDLFLGVFKVLLHRYSGLNEIVVGTSMTNRLQNELKNVVGPIANLVVLRSFIEQNTDFMTVLKNVSKNVREAEKYQAMPFDKLVLELDPENDMSRTALFDVLFQYEDSIEIDTEVEGSKWQVVETNLGWGKYDLNLLINKNGDKFSGVLTFNEDYYNKETIERLIGHYLILCEKFVDEPGLNISKVCYLSDEEIKRLLYDWNQTEAEYPKNKCIHDLFMEQAERTPLNIAVKCGEEQITYGELNIRTNRIARILRSKGVKPDAIVGMLFDRTPWMITAILSILKAGGAYLPIASDYPEDRINYLLSDSKTKLILTTSDLINKCNFDGEVICLDTLECEGESHENIESINSPSDLAYIIYTSGTTGNPKGVMIEHRNVVRLMFNDSFLFDFGENDVWTMFHSYNFDFSVWEMYGALLYGGKLVMVTTMVARDTKSFLKLLEDEAVTVLNQTPQAFYNLVAQELDKSPSDLKIKYVIFGGEALNPCKLKGWKERYPHTRLVNMYGITETTVHVTYKEIQDEEIDLNISNIGKPLPTLTAYVMDSELALVPVGVPGELMVGGKGVGRGYLECHELTCEKFIDNPYKHGERLYRSGDLVRYLSNGEMEYCGRIDHQVKIRGFRIELGEIEAVLVKSPDIKDAVVVARKGKNEELSLISFIVWETDSQKDTNRLRAYMKETLPDYMIPSVFVSMAALPITSNGKVDRKALPEVTDSKRDAGALYIEPQTELEKAVAAIWMDVLDINKVGIDDNFFYIGGNSLVVAKIVYRFNEMFKLNLTFPYFFTNPTIRAMVRFAENQNEASPDANKDAFLLNEVQLDESIKPGTGLEFNMQAVGDIFLTGATGFLGAFLLKDLLDLTDSRIHCLVRASTMEDGMKRIIDNLSYYLIDINDLKDRIIPVPGDMEKPLLGLSKEQFSLLAEEIGIIYHNGAVARYMYPYENLKAANVLGTQEIIRLSCTGKLKPVHYVSTVSVFNSTVGDVLKEGDLPQIPGSSEGGYVQSKWVAEQILGLARRRGVPVNIYRPGRISGHSVTGACQTNDFLWQMIRSCFEAGCIFDGQMSFDMVPVDYVSKAIVELSLMKECKNMNFHLTGDKNIELKDIYRWISAEGIKLGTVSYKEWFNRLENHANENDNSMASKVISILPEDMSFEAHSVRYDDSNVSGRLKGVVMPPKILDESIFRTNFMFLVKTGYIELSLT